MVRTIEKVIKGGMLLSFLLMGVEIGDSKNAFLEWFIWEGKMVANILIGFAMLDLLERRKDGRLKGFKSHEENDTAGSC